MKKRTYGYHPIIRESGPDVAEDIMVFLSAVVCLVLDRYIPSRRNRMLHKHFVEGTLITAMVVPCQEGGGNRISIRVQSGGVMTQLYAGIRPSEDVKALAPSPAKGRLVN